MLGIDVNGSVIHRRDWIYWWKVYGTQVAMYEGEVVDAGMDGAGPYLEVMPFQTTGIMHGGRYEWKWRPTTKADFKSETTKIRRVDRVLKIGV